MRRRLGADQMRGEFLVRHALDLRPPHAELGNGHFIINMQIGNIPDAIVRRGIELFRDRVLPEARGL